MGFRGQDVQISTMRTFLMNTIAMEMGCEICSMMFRRAYYTIAQTLTTYDEYGQPQPISSDLVDMILTDRSQYRARMSSRYDDIRAAYEEMRKLPISVLQDANVEAAVAPFIKGAYYSKKFLEWGAEQVVGIDISKAMVHAANAASTNSNRLNFYDEDCSVPAQHEDGPFDVVFGACG